MKSFKLNVLYLQKRDLKSQFSNLDPKELNISHFQSKDDSIFRDSELIIYTLWRNDQREDYIIKSRH